MYSLQAVTAQVGWLGLRVSCKLSTKRPLSHEPSELSQWSCDDDSTTINGFVGLKIRVLWKSSSVTAELAQSAIMPPHTLRQILEVVLTFWPKRPWRLLSRSLQPMRQRTVINCWAMTPTGGSGQVHALKCHAWPRRRFARGCKLDNESLNKTRDQDWDFPRILQDRGEMFYYEPRRDWDVFKYLTDRW